MSPHDTALEQNDYRLVLVKSGSHAIWAQRRGPDLCLPRIAIPRWARPAEELQQAIESWWSIRSIILDILPGKKESAPCALVEVMSSESPNSLAAINRDELAEDEMTSEERDAVEAILTGESGAIGPFSRLGWIAEAVEWLSASVGYKVELTGEIRQYNAAATFALVHFATKQGPAYWLKATGKPNGHEFTVTTTLSILFPQHLPPLVAARCDWNAWVMEDAGKSLGDSFTLPALERAVVALAELQMLSTKHIQELLVAGCFDQRTAVLKAHLGELIVYLGEAMASQTSTRVPQLGNSRLRELGSMVNDAYSLLEELRIPVALNHNDINPGNILFDGSRCVFTDWAEACIGNPFSTFQQLIEQVASQTHNNEWCYGLKALCRNQWRSVLTESQIESALAIAPLLAIASYLFGRGAWLTSSHRGDARSLSYARSLARHLDRAAETPEVREALCR